jgi:hypothetical protein
VPGILSGGILPAFSDKLVLLFGWNISALTMSQPNSMLEAKAIDLRHEMRHSIHLSWPFNWQTRRIWSISHWHWFRSRYHLWYRLLSIIYFFSIYTYFLIGRHFVFGSCIGSMHGARILYDPETVERQACDRLIVIYHRLRLQRSYILVGLPQLEVTKKLHPCGTPTVRGYTDVPSLWDPPS